MPRPRKFRSAKALADAWEQYKVWCNDQEVLTHDFSSKNSEFVSAKLKRSVTYTIEGFCVWAKISRSIFDTTYAEDERFSDIVTRMREECEVDARMKFELGIIDTKLAPLWMSRHGYSTKLEAIRTTIPRPDALLTAAAVVQWERPSTRHRRRGASPASSSNRKNMLGCVECWERNIQSPRLEKYE